MNTRISDWRGKRVWVIGASSGIGHAFAEALLERGARVALSARGADALEALARKFPPEQSMVLPVDVTDSSDIDESYSRLRDLWSGIDLLVLLAGTHLPVRAWELNAGTAEHLFMINVFGVMRTLELVVPDLVARGDGGIAVVSSVAGYRGLPTSLVYGASKAALINFAETLYLDLRPKGVNVYLVNPGFVKTPLTDRNEFEMPALISPQEAAEQMLRGLSRGQFEIDFPKRFTRLMKLLRLLPYRLFFPLVHRITGL
ncbi:MAG: SDR family NAD(P)-dependent oxidoreductase [Betaproteobacteria bacterium]|nr:MAG: SDR family NAD(P)-dependent oxidoreductase [Betaproteobacteria bacterium]